MSHDTQARAPARMIRRYPQGWAALLCLYCIPYNAAAQSEEDRAAGSATAEVAAADSSSKLIAPSRDTDVDRLARPESTVQPPAAVVAVGTGPAGRVDAAAPSRSAEPTNAATTPPGRSGSAAVSGGPGVVNINTAAAAELERLPRIGPARAQAILGLRTKLKQFSRVEQLLQVKGIGRATFRMLRPLLTLTGPTTLEHKRGR